MIALAIVVAILILIALFRFGVSVEYSSDGVTVKAQVGPLKLRVFPREVSPKKEAKQKLKKAAKKEKAALKKALKKQKPKDEKKPGGLKMFFEVLPSVKTALGRIRRRLLIKRLTIHYTAGGEDPATAALTYGAANAAFNTVVPLLEKAFRIKRKDLRASFDFDAPEPLIYVNVAISLAVWEAIYIGLSFGKFAVSQSRGAARKPNNRKDVDDGQAPNE